MIYDIRGTHGSGKSHVVHGLIAKDGDKKLITDAEGKVLGTYLPSFELAVLGKYDNVCGGCDQISPVDEIQRRVELFNREYKNVMLEGILVAHTHKRWSDCAKELGKWRFCFLNTPLEQCILNVMKRRTEAGKPAEFNEENLRKDFRQISVNVKRKMIDDGHVVVELDHKRSVEQMLMLMEFHKDD